MGAKLSQPDQQAPPSPCVSLLSGTCCLALLPSGHMSGHMVEPRSKMAYGIMARCIASSSGRAGCMEDEDLDFLRLRIVNFEVGISIALRQPTLNVNAWLLGFMRTDTGRS